MFLVRYSFWKILLRIGKNSPLFTQSPTNKPQLVTGGLTNPAPGAEDAEPVALIPVGLPCLERGRLYKKKPQLIGIDV